MLKVAVELALMRPLLWMTSSSPPPSMPTALVTAPELAPVPEEPNATFEPPEETWVDLALTLTSPSFVMLSRPLPPAKPHASDLPSPDHLVWRLPPHPKPEHQTRRLAPAQAG